MGAVEYPSPAVSQGPAPLHFHNRFLRDVKYNSMLYGWSLLVIYFLYQFSPVAQLCLTLCDLMDCTYQASLSITSSQNLLKLMSKESVMPIQPSHPLPSPFPPAFHLSQHQGLFQ